MFIIGQSGWVNFNAQCKSQPTALNPNLNPNPNPGSGVYINKSELLIQLPQAALEGNLGPHAQQCIIKQICPGVCDTEYIILCLLFSLCMSC